MCVYIVTWSLRRTCTSYRGTEAEIKVVTIFNTILKRILHIIFNKLTSKDIARLFVGYDRYLTF